MRVVRYIGAGEDLPVLAKGNASVLETDDHAFHGVYHAMVRGLLLSVAAATTLTAQLNSNSAGDDVPILKKGNAAVLEVDDHAFGSGYQAAIAALQSQAAQTQRLTALLAPYSVGDNVPVLSQQASPALELDDSGYAFVPPPEKPFVVTPPDEDYPLWGMQDDSGFGWVVVASPQIYVRANIGDDDFAPTTLSLALPDDDGEPAFVPVPPKVFQVPVVEEDFSTVVPFEDDAPPSVKPAKILIPLAPVVEDELPIAAPVFIFSDNEGLPPAIVVPPVGTRLLAPDEEYPQLVAAAPTLAVPDDELPALVRTTQPRVILATQLDEDIPIAVTSIAFEDDVQVFVSRPVPAFVPQPWLDEFPLLVAPTIAFEEDAPVPRVPVLPPPFRGTVGDDSAFMVGIPTVIPLGGKYKPEHDSALVDLGAARGFQTEHDSALRDIGNAKGFSSEHASALKDLGDAGI